MIMVPYLYYKSANYLLDRKKKYNIINIGKDKNNLKPLSITEQLVYQELFKNGDSNGTIRTATT